MNRRGFFLTLAGAATAGAAALVTSGEAEAAPIAGLPTEAPGLDLDNVQYYYRRRRRCRRVWNGYHWVVRCW